MENVNEEKIDYGSYYIFVFVSAIIGFFAVFFVYGACIDRFTNSPGLSFLNNSKVLSSALVALVAAIIFIFVSLINKKFLRNIYLSELFLYLYMGVLTTVVNIVAFEVLRNKFAASGGEAGAGWKLAEVLAFIIGVLFAFVTNKIFVFKSLTFDIKKIFAELGGFVGARVVTEAINFGVMWFMIDKNHMNELFTKVVASVIVVILNYIFSKFLIFKGTSKV